MKDGKLWCDDVKWIFGLVCYELMNWVRLFIFFDKKKWVEFKLYVIFCLFFYVCGLVDYLGCKGEKLFFKRLFMFM